MKRLVGKVKRCIWCENHLELRSTPELLADELPADAGTAMGRPRAFSVSARSSVSMSSRVVRASSSTSAAVRFLVGIGSKTEKLLATIIYFLVVDVKVPTFNGNGSRAKNHALDMQDMAIIRHHNRHNRHARLDSQMKSTLFKRQQHGILGITPRPLGEHVHALLPALDLLCRTGHGVPRVLGVLAVDEDGAAEAHEPA